MFVCLFDIDGTLIDTGGAGRAAMYEAVRTVFGVPQIIDGVPFTGRTDRAIVRDLLERHGVPATDQNLARSFDAYVSHLPQSLVDHSHGRVLPGIGALLGSLACRADVKVGLLTGNIREGARRKLQHYGLAEYFPFGAFGDDHYDRNAVARDSVQIVARHLGRPHPADRTWVIGDTPLDVACARAIGARALAVQTGWSTVEELTESQPDLMLADLSEPTPFLERLVS